MVDWMPGNVGLSTFFDEDKDDHEMLDFALIYIGAHNVYYVKYGGFVLNFMNSPLSLCRADYFPLLIKIMPLNMNGSAPNQAALSALCQKIMLPFLNAPGVNPLETAS